MRIHVIIIHEHTSLRANLDVINMKNTKIYRKLCDLILAQTVNATCSLTTECDNMLDDKTDATSPVYFRSGTQAGNTKFYSSTHKHWPTRYCHLYCFDFFGTTNENLVRDLVSDTQ